MMHKELPPIFVCPVDRTPLTAADENMILRINRGIAAGRVKNQSGRLVEQPIGGGLVRRDQTALYPILDGIPVLLADEAIPLTQFSGSSGTAKK
jgi:uncharacterized protein YbaR (Trm112 family)